MKKRRLLILCGSALIVLTAVIYWALPRERHGDGLSVPDEDIQEINQLYGIDYSDLVLDEGIFESGQTISSLFAKYGVSPVMVDRTAKAAQDVFPLRNIRAGNKYTAFLAEDSTSRLVHFVYEQNIKDFIIISYRGDSVSVRREQKNVETHRRTASSTITSSLWNSMVAQNISPALSMNFEEIYAWTIDFFGLQPGDHYTVIYDELSIEGSPVGVGRIWGAIFHHSGKDYYAIPFKQGDKITYWDEKANSLRKAMLKAPLSYTRISSKFSNSRLHPVLKIRRPHHGVDYAAPSGTPVIAVADGTIVMAGWDGKGGGNTIKIKHARGMQTGYLHLRGFAKGIKAGAHVSQGQLIGYVGSTGTSTGPHLDYRVWINGKATDPLKITAEPAEPIDKSQLADFEIIKGRVMSELSGTLAADSLRVTQLDSISVYRRQEKELRAVADSLTN